MRKFHRARERSDVAEVIHGLPSYLAHTRSGVVDGPGRRLQFKGQKDPWRTETWSKEVGHGEGD